MADEQFPPLQQQLTDAKGFVSKGEWWLWFTKIIARLATAITGSGTAGKLPKFSASQTLADSIVTESSGNIEVGGSLTVTTGATVDGGATVEDGLSLDSGATVDDFSDDETMADESATALVTERAIVAWFRSKNLDYDEISTTRNSENDVTQRLWKRSSVTKTTETLTYNEYYNVATQTFSGEVNQAWTYTYSLANGEYIITTKAIT